MKKAHRAFFVLSLLALLTACMPYYEKYSRLDRKEGITRKEFRQENRVCELHNEHMQFVTLPISYGYGGFVDAKIENAPHHHENNYTGGCIKRPFRWFATGLYCPKCQKEYRKVKRQLRRLK